jgi:hypothetical protein
MAQLGKLVVTWPANVGGIGLEHSDSVHRIRAEEGIAKLVPYISRGLFWTRPVIASCALGPFTGSLLGSLAFSYTVGDSGSLPLIRGKYWARKRLE